MAVDDGEVFFVDLAALHGEGETAGGLGILGDEDEATGFAIEAVDDGEGGIGTGEVVGEELLEAVEECGGVIWFAGVNEEVGGFMDDDIVVGLVDDGEIRVMEGVFDIGGEFEVIRSQYLVFGWGVARASWAKFWLVRL